LGIATLELSGVSEKGRAGQSHKRRGL